MPDDAHTPDRHSADAAILGFAYQIRFALHLLLSSWNSLGSDAAVTIERFDDIDVSDASRVLHLVQTKRTATALTNASAPLWKTLRVWTDAIAQGTIDPSVVTFSLFCTSPAPDDSIAALLQQRSTESRRSALAALRGIVAVHPYPRHLAAAYTSFAALSPEQQETLIAHIEMNAAAPSFDDLDALIRDQIVWGPPGLQNRKAFSAVLFTEWNGLVEATLRGHAPRRIGWFDLQSLTHAIHKQFQDDSLPTDFAGMLASALPALCDDARRFVQQLDAIQANESQKRRAQHDEQKARQLQSFWLRHGLLRPDELPTYHTTLTEACNVIHEGRDLTQDWNSPDKLAAFGRSVYQWACSHACVSFPIRRFCNDHAVVRGTFHILADKPDIGWHPDWQSMF